MSLFHVLILLFSVITPIQPCNYGELENLAFKGKMQLAPGCKSSGLCTVFCKNENETMGQGAPPTTTALTLQCSGGEWMFPANKEMITDENPAASRFSESTLTCNSNNPLEYKTP